MTRRFCVLDYETYSEADLPEVGGFEYSVHKSTSILCVGYVIGTLEELKTKKATVWSPHIAAPYGELKRALLDPSVMLVAHNAFFEQVITRNVLSRIINRNELLSIPHSRWICTASLARASALPGKLEIVSQVLKLSNGKDMEGHRLMLKMSQPRRPTKHNPSTRHRKLSDLKRVMQYCATDVELETQLLLRLTPLIPSERELWLLDQKINFRGFRVDRDLVKKSLKLIEQETVHLNEECKQITNGKVIAATQREKLLDFIHGLSVSLLDMKAATVSDALGDPTIQGYARRLLEIRQATSKSSTAKFEAFEKRSRVDGRCRDAFVFHQASTGRFAGSGVQPQNFPRLSQADHNTAIEIVKNCSLDFIRAMYGDVMLFLSSLLRNVIIPEPGKEFFCGDFAMIEVCVLFWVADHMKGLSLLRSGGKLYEPMAAEIYQCDESEIIKTDPRRQVGKVTVLGGGFGMGATRFVVQAKEQFGIVVSDEIGVRAIAAYRKVNRPVVRLWSNLERAAIAAVLNPGKAYKVNHTKWFMRGSALMCELPSGRRLSYQGAHVKYEIKWGEKRPKLRYFGLWKGSKWMLESTWGGKLTENVIQAIALDLLTYGMKRVENAGYDTVLHAHDEILAEREIGKGNLDEFNLLMAEVPEWGKGIPVKVEAWCEDRYRK